MLNTWCKSTQPDRAAADLLQVTVGHSTMPVRAVARLSLSRPERFVVFDLLVNFSAEDWKSRRLQCRELRSFPLVALVCWLASFQVTSVEEGYPCGGSSCSNSMLVTLVTHAKDSTTCAIHNSYVGTRQKVQLPIWLSTKRYDLSPGTRFRGSRSVDLHVGAEIQAKSCSSTLKSRCTSERCQAHRYTIVLRSLSQQQASRHPPSEAMKQLSVKLINL